MKSTDKRALSSRPPYWLVIAAANPFSLMHIAQSQVLNSLLVIFYYLIGFNVLVIHQECFYSNKAKNE